MECCSKEAVKAKIEQLQKKVEPVESVVKDHPIPSVIVGIGAGVLIGALASKYCIRRRE